MLKRLRWTLLWALVILVLCLIPGKDLPRYRWADLLSFDKFVHAGVFFVLAWLMVVAVKPTWDTRAVRWTAVVCVVYGGLLEVMQGTLMTDRYADIGDFVANGLGVALGLWWWARKERARSSFVGQGN